MANCVYSLFGRHFNSELDLDNFLFSNREFLNLDNISDIVFSLSQEQLAAKDLAELRLREALGTIELSGQLGVVVNELKQRKRNGELLSPDEAALANNFYGVNFALGQLDNIDDPRHKLTTTFNEENYALELFEAWHKPSDQRTLKELEAIQKTVNLINKISGNLDTASIDSPPDLRVPDSKRNDINIPLSLRYPGSWNLFQYIRTYWQNIGRSGSVIHYIAEQFWKGRTDIDTIKNEIANNPEFNTVGINTSTVGGTVEKVFSIMATLKAKLEELHTVNGVKPIFKPEFVVTHDLNCSIKGNNQAKLMGIIDLLVIDGNGTPHIYDYKTSDKQTALWSQSKEDAFLSQTGAYREVLRAWGLNTDSTTIGIVPLLMTGFTLDDSLNPKFDNIEWENLDISNPDKMFGTILFLHTSLKLNPTNVFTRSMRRYLGTEEMAKRLTSQESRDFINKFSYYLKQMFPNYSFLDELNESIIRDIVRYARKDRNNGKWYLDTPKASDRQYFDSKEDITEAAIRDYHEKTMANNEENLKRDISSIKFAIAQHSVDLLPEPRYALNGQRDGNWFVNNFRRYCGEEWSVIECDALEEAGIIALYNKERGYVDFIGLTSISLTTPVELKKGNNTILGNFLNDLNPQYQGISPLISDVGNIELMKTCLAVNLVASKLLPKGAKVGNIRVINLEYQQGRMPVSKQTLDNFNELCNLLNLYEEDSTKLENNFTNYNILVLTADQKARLVVLEMCKKLPEKKYRTMASKYEKTGADIRMSLDDLNQVRRELEAADSALARGEVDTKTPQGLMYLTVMLAIAEINGAFYTQEMRDGNKTMLINNPEVMNSPNIRKLYNVVDNAVMKYRNGMNEYTAEWRKRTQKFKKEMGYNDAIGQSRRYMLDSDYYMYQNMYEYDKETGVFKFKDPWDPTNDLKKPERELLKWYLDAQFDMRFKGTKDFTDENRAALRADRNSVYYDVPLLKADTLEKIVNGKSKGMVNWFKRHMEWFKHPFKMSRELVQNAHNQEDYELQKLNAQIYQMIDRFEYSENGNRMRLIKDNDEYYFSHSLDRIFYNYAAVKLRKEVMDEYIPIMKAILVSLKGQQLLDGVGLSNLQKYVTDYILAKVLDQSLVDDDYKIIQEVLGNMKMVTTIGALGFNPKSGLFQVFEGVFKNFSRSYSFSKPMGDLQFGTKEYIKALRELFGDSKNHFRVVSLGQLLNEKYGINDQDSNQLANRLREGQNSLTFLGKAMWLTSAPDFLNRMGIFIAQMIKDGCYEAHELDQKNMTIRYNFKKDKRFKVYNDPNANKNSLEYRKQKALYERMIDLFNEEGYTTIDARTGYERRLEIGDDLPQAYTNKEARSLKSFADQLYGYYNHESKMLLNSYLLGSLYTQFRTYWSSLRNRWWLKGNVYNQGHWEQMKTDDGQLIYKKVIVNEDGEDRIELVWGDEADPETMDPAMDWKGHYLEGFLLSIGSFFTEAVLSSDNDKGFIERYKDWKSGNGDESKGNTRKSNLRLMLHDLAVWALIAWLASLFIDALKEQAKEDKYKNLTMLEKFERDAAKTFAYSLSSSVDDLGAVKDLFNPITDWTPPSFKFAKNVYTDTGEWLSGDKDFHKVLSENIGLIRQTENIFFL